MIAPALSCEALVLEGRLSPCALRGVATPSPTRMNRRQFIETVATSLLATPILASAKSTSTRLPVRSFGRTGLKVPILGFGSGSRFLMYEHEDKAIEALNHAIDLGITYIDTAHAY